MLTKRTECHSAIQTNTTIDVDNVKLSKIKTSPVHPDEKIKHQSSLKYSTEIKDNFLQLKSQVVSQYYVI